ncbi:NADH dehydrogenase [ubiquinone] 1 alpha subcomplex assembly factor 2 isoform X2 [Pantherophis guttatus]|uniref:NADH dehydrogenase [ubiquinone] 1 alpha subcomplex assembly factor 2 isoform X2 n=1 Tax=Pantherophis guttatus TaxID=94885 RepID=A0ABM3ZE53_PANGU|nr:NADH dehydrogenase [ubiquinone] 1 alpha subcomplex assembly factor 2 isoform X2 [Pantherophis guttatus]
MSGVGRFLRLLKQRFIGRGSEYVGIDHFGNKYYRIPQHKTWAAWMKKRRNNPPTLEECIQNMNYRKEMRAKVEDLGEKTKLLQDKEGLEVGPLQTQITGHASASSYGKPERSEDPVSTANTFQPGAWMPPDRKK